MTSLPPQLAELTAVDNHAKLEQESVHQVYDVIAGHFSATRYKPWPVVEAYLADQPSGSLGIDIGCGNGKYLGVNRAVVTIGVDRSENLVSICHERGFQALVCDGLAVPFPDNKFDFAISIAVIHHFSSPDRRMRAIREVLRLIRPRGSALVYVWAMEQKGKRKFPGQDVYVPWHMPTWHEKPGGAKQGGKDDQEAQRQKQDQEPVDKVYMRYYHLFVQGELEELVVAAGGKVVRSGYDRDNHYCVITKDE
ncbi:hypothetical protein BCR44DRAFT_121630 [Catenaria anguillulae PL171]|uniref:Methyltransferase type 11 domain-containing protein n=1 Tax=Catenaria anguillulae PL171 TaxID=765915 RepID=A0A1Y2I338_9FUNG|nr:hypothetical protein BCR44DRAFT_121630 [Catenaria anguillulae PL171]